MMFFKKNCALPFEIMLMTLFAWEINLENPLPQINRNEYTLILSPSLLPFQFLFLCSGATDLEVDWLS